MPCSFQLEIAESVESLEKKRLQMLWWLKSGQVKQHQELTRRWRRKGSTISHWLQQHRNRELAALLAIKTAPGRTPAIEGEVLKKLQARWEQPEGFQRYGEIQHWLNNECGLCVEYKTVHQTGRDRLGANLKVPRPHRIQHDEQAVEPFKQHSPGADAAAKLVWQGKASALFGSRPNTDQTQERNSTSYNQLRGSACGSSAMATRSLLD